MTTALPPNTPRYRKPRRGKSLPLPPTVNFSPLPSPLSAKPITLKRPSRVPPRVHTRAPVRAPARVRAYPRNREEITPPFRQWVIDWANDSNEYGETLVCVAMGLGTIAIALAVIDRWQELTMLTAFAR